MKHRIIEWFGLEGTPTIIEFQPPCSRQGHLPLHQGAPSPTSLALCPQTKTNHVCLLKPRNSRSREDTAPLIISLLCREGLKAGRSPTASKAPSRSPDISDLTLSVMSLSAVPLYHQKPGGRIHGRKSERFKGPLCNNELLMYCMNILSFLQHCQLHQDPPTEIIHFHC